jgi:signal peptidase II
MLVKPGMGKAANLFAEFYRRGALFLGVALPVIALDQLTKYIVKTNMTLGQSIPESGLFHWTYVQNTGAAFSIFREHTHLLSIFSIIGIILLLFIVFYMSTRFDFLRSPWARLSLGLIMGGTVGNLIDRLSYGYVIDFIDVDFFATFNVADSAITVGAVLLAITYIRLARD